MVTVEQISWVLKNYNNVITRVEVADGRVYSKLESWIDPEQPYSLVIQPDEEDLMLKISLYPILKIRRNIDTFRMLLNLNLELLSCGCAAVKTNGEVILKIGYFCEDNDSGPSPWIIARLLDECVRELRMLEDFLLWATMIDAGISPEQARQTVMTLFRENLQALIDNSGVKTTKDQDKSSKLQRQKGGNNQ